VNASFFIFRHFDLPSARPTRWAQWLPLAPARGECHIWSPRARRPQLLQAVMLRRRGGPHAGRNLYASAAAKAVLTCSDVGGALCRRAGYADCGCIDPRHGEWR
jgi:hypothetical protein